MQIFTQPRIHHFFAFAIALGMSLGSASVFAGSWFGGETVKGNGVVKKQDRSLATFKGIELSMPVEVEVRQGTTESVSIEADENLLPLVETSIKGGTLQIRAVRRNLKIDARTLKIIVNAKEISQLAVGGAGTITAAVLKTPKLELEIGGSGSIEVKQVQSDAVEASIGGSGNVKLGGVARKLAVSIGGSGDVDAQQLKADEVNISIGGSGDAKLWSITSLNASIAGSGDVQYWGDPKMSSSVAGSGTVKRLGATPR
jgi:hypothetical protein